MLLRTGLLALAAALSAPAVGHAASWQTYVNDRFGSTADVPADWRGGEAPANDDGLRFTSPDGQAWIIVSGGLHVWDTIGEAMSILETPNDGEQITYRHLETRLLVISGLKRDRIFYRKSILSCHDMVWNSVAIEYPSAKKQIFDPIIAQVAKSLRPGKSLQVVECNGQASSSKVTLIATGGSLSRQPSDRLSGNPADDSAMARNSSTRQLSTADVQGSDSTSAGASDQDMQRSDDTMSSHSDM